MIRILLVIVIVATVALIGIAIGDQNNDHSGIGPSAHAALGERGAA